MMTRNQYVRKYGYMAWLGREALNKEIKSILNGFNLDASNKQVNRLSEMVEAHIKKGKINDHHRRHG